MPPQARKTTKVVNFPKKLTEPGLAIVRLQRLLWFLEHPERVADRIEEVPTDAT